MSLRLLIDMNLSPEWVPALRAQGWDAIHWSTVGSPAAPDAELMAWALAHGQIVFTHDLDFGTALALTQAAGPSVLQIRGQHVLPENSLPLVTAVLRQYEQELIGGALVTLDENRSRVRILPLGQAPS